MQGCEDGKETTELALFGVAGGHQAPSQLSFRFWWQILTVINILSLLPHLLSTFTGKLIYNGCEGVKATELTLFGVAGRHQVPSQLSWSDTTVSVAIHYQS